MQEEQLKLSSIDNLKTLLEHEERGQCPILVAFNKNEICGTFQLGPEWLVSPSTELMSKIKDKIEAIESVDIVY